MCLPIKTLAGSEESYSISQSELNSRFDYFGSLVALGNIQLTDSEQNNRQSVHRTAIKRLENVSNIVQGVGPAFSVLSGTVSNEPTSVDALR